MSFDELLRTLARDYLQALPEKIQIILGQIQAQDASNVRESFHKLKGTGKTYGFPEVSELAAVVENICIVQPAAGLNAAAKAIPLLEDIHRSRQTAAGFSLKDDTRFDDIRKLLPS